MAPWRKPWAVWGPNSISEATNGTERTGGMRSLVRYRDPRAVDNSRQQWDLLDAWQTGIRLPGPSGRHPDLDGRRTGHLRSAAGGHRLRFARRSDLVARPCRPLHRPDRLLSRGSLWRPTPGRRPHLLPAGSSRPVAPLHGRRRWRLGDTCEFVVVGRRGRDRGGWDQDPFRHHPASGAHPRLTSGK